jgi:hypothetical protein
MLPPSDEDLNPIAAQSSTAATHWILTDPHFTYTPKGRQAEFNRQLPKSNPDPFA